MESHNDMVDMEYCCKSSPQNETTDGKRRSYATTLHNRTSYLRQSKFLTVPHNYGSSLWLIVLIIHSFVLFSNAQDSFVLGFHKTYDFESDIGDPSPNSPDLGDDDDFNRKNMHLYAVTGHLFNRSLVEEVKAFDPNVLSKGDIIKVHFPKYERPGSRWLVYKDNDLLQGVPLSAHEGRNCFYITVVHVNAPSQPTLTLPCTIEVIPQERALELRHSYQSSKLTIGSDVLCASHDPVIIATVTLEAKSKDLSHLDRMHCVENLARFFDLPPKDVNFHSSEASLARDEPIQSGPGNVPRRANDLQTVSLAWSLGCNSDIIGDIPSLDKLEATALDSSLAQAIGYDVTGWKIVNRVYHTRRMNRVKRQSGTVPSSASIFHPPATKLLFSGENVKVMEEVKSDRVGHLQSGRTRVAANTIRATPVPEIPVLASRIVTPAAQSGRVIPPSTPSITSPIFSQPDSSFDDNGAPSMLFGMTDITAYIGTYMESRIPNGAFFDAEDGLTRQLNLELLDAKTNENVSQDQTWLMFDSEAQLICGVPDETAVADRELILVARDSGGKSASMSLFMYIDLEDVRSPYSHKYTFYFSRSPELSDNANYRLFGKKLTPALAIKESEQGKLTMTATGLTEDGKQRYISWFDRDIDQKGVCNSRNIKDQADLMIGNDAHPGLNKPAREFAAKFRPEYKLKSIEIELLGPCKKHTTTTTTTLVPPSSTTTAATTTTTTKATTTEVFLTTSTTTQSSSTQPVVPMTDSSDAVTKTSGKTDSPQSTTAIPPQVKMRALPAVSAQAGKVTRYVLPQGIFSHPSIMEGKLNLRFAEVPSWIAFDSNTRSLYLMPTLEDYSHLESHNSTYGKWSGQILAKTVEGPESDPITVRIFVQKTKSSYEDEANHRFFMVIKNYEVSNFDGMDRIHLLNATAGVFGDENTDNIRFYPIRKGSVVFSWYNSSLSHIQPCPYMKIAKLSQKVFKDNNINPEIEARFRDEGFAVANLNLTKTPWCKVKNMPTPPTEAPTTTLNVGIAGQQGKSTTVIIIAVIVICLMILIVILVVKCRMGQKEKEKREERREKLEREEAAIAAGSPDMSQTPRIKKGVPIIFQDELAMEPNGNANASPSTPLMSNRTNGNTRSPAVTEDDENIHEETKFTIPSSHHHPMTPPTPIMSDRPPPPYVKSR